MFLLFFSVAEGDINDVLIKTLSEAHLNTNVKLEVVHEMFRKPQVRNGDEKEGCVMRKIYTMPHFSFQDLQRILYYKNLGQEELWLDCAEKLTAMIQNIIEFAKLIPGFMRLSQDDQVSWAAPNNCRPVFDLSY